MKDQIVFWGADANDQRVLVTLRLRAQENKVDIWTFPHDKVDSNFVTKMLGDWDGIDVESFPPVFEYIERNVTDSELLPETIKAENTQLVIRAEKEWHVKVLSLRFYEMLKSEIDALKEQVDGLTSYEKVAWDSSKQYWDKVLQHIQEKTLSRDQASALRAQINECFNRLKFLMSQENEQYKDQSIANFEEIKKRIQSFDKQMVDGKNAGHLFNDLKKFQTEIKNVRLLPVHKRDVRKLMNKIFEAVKEKRGSAFAERSNKRIEGLNGAIAKMKASIKYDQESIDFQNRRKDDSRAGQLESQLRVAKIKMIESRIESKKEKLLDMEKTLEKLQKTNSKHSKPEAKAPKKAEAKPAKAANAAPKKREDPKSDKAEVAAKDKTESPAEAKTETAKPAEVKAESPKPAETKAETAKPADANPVEGTAAITEKIAPAAIVVEKMMEKKSPEPSIEAETPKVEMPKIEVAELSPQAPEAEPLKEAAKAKEETPQEAPKATTDEPKIETKDDNNSEEEE